MEAPSLALLQAPKPPGMLAGRQHLSTHLLFVPFWVLDKHHHVSLPSADGVHGELGRLLHHVSSGLDSCHSFTQAHYKLGQALIRASTPRVSLRKLRDGTQLCTYHVGDRGRLP